MVRRGGLEPPRCYSLAPQASASANSAISAHSRTCLRYFFGVCCCCGAFGGGVKSIGTVLLSPVDGSVNVTEGCPGFTAPGAPGVTGTGEVGTGAGIVVVELAGCFVDAGPGCFSSIVLPTPVPRVARIESVSDVSMNRIAEAVVAFESSVAEPRGPNA